MHEGTGESVEVDLGHVDPGSLWIDVFVVALGFALVLKMTLLERLGHGVVSSSAQPSHP